MAINFRFGFFLVVLVAAIPLFAHLDQLPVQPYDEARLATNAFEMYKGNSHILVPTYGGVPDMWNTKPPFLIWVQALFIKVLGANESAIRLPSALAALATCLLMYWFCAKKLNKPLLGLLTVMVLVTSQGYIRIHGTRTADYDAMLSFLTTAYCLFYYLFLTSRKDKYAYTAFLCMAMAVLTKGVAALFFLPALVVFTLLYKQGYFVFRSKAFYMGVAIFLTVSCGYYLLREQLNTGYIQAVMENEWGGRFNTVIENHEEGKWYYWGWTMGEGFRYWAMMIPFGIVIALQTAGRRIKRVTIFTLLLVATHFAVITGAQTKINWYDIPEYSFLSLLAALFIFYLLRIMLVMLRSRKALRYNRAPYLFLLFLFATPYYNISASVLNPDAGLWLKENMNMGTFLKDARKGKHNIKDYSIVWEYAEPNICWYIMADGGKNNIHGTYGQNLVVGNTAAVFKESTKKYVEMTYFSTVIRNYNGGTVYKIHGRK